MYTLSRIPFRYTIYSKVWHTNVHTDRSLLGHFINVSIENVEPLEGETMFMFIS